MSVASAIGLNLVRLQVYHTERPPCPARVGFTQTAGAAGKNGRLVLWSPYMGQCGRCGRCGVSTDQNSDDNREQKRWFIDYRWKQQVMVKSSACEYAVYAAWRPIPVLPIGCGMGITCRYCTRHLALVTLTAGLVGLA